MEVSLAVILSLGLLIAGHQIVLALAGKERLSDSELQALKTYYEAVLGVDLIVEGREGIEVYGVEDGWGERIAAWNAEFMVRV